ncbi:twitching motility protein PilT [Spirochaetia bacterium]|nr:twitching motility protein PilT [Spirochaetia bacterium]
MNNIFVDSSAWIEYFKGNKDYEFLKNLIVNNTICTNDIILTELLPSIIHRKEVHLAELLNSLRKYILLIDWQDIRNIQISNLKHGNNHIGVADIIIVQNCIQNNLKIISHDNHFRAMEKYIPLEFYKLFY